MTTILVPAILSLLALLGTVVTAAFAYYSNRKIAAVEVKTDLQTSTINAAAQTAVETSHKADTIIEKAVEIHTLTNSNLSKVTASLEMALAEIKGIKEKSAVEIHGLRDAIARMEEDKRVAATVAQLLADKVAPLVPVPAPANIPPLPLDEGKAAVEVVIEGTMETTDQG